MYSSYTYEVKKLAMEMGNRLRKSIKRLEDACQGLKNLDRAKEVLLSEKSNKKKA